MGYGFRVKRRRSSTLFETKLFDVMITDIRMPGMDGVELLRRVSLKYPKTIRFVLSGQSETEAIIRSIDLRINTSQTMQRGQRKDRDFRACPARYSRGR